MTISIQPKRIVITQTLGIRAGGAENVLWTLLNSLEPALCETTVVLFSDGPFRGELESAGIPVRVIPTGRLREIISGIRAIVDLRRLLAELAPDLIIHWGAKANLYGSPACVLAGLGRRSLWWQHDLPRTGWIHKLSTLLPARLVVCLSRDVAAAQQRLLPHRRTQVLQAGIADCESHVATGSWADNVQGRTVIGLVGRLQPWKGQHRVIDVVSSLLQEGLDVHLLIVGGDPHNFSPGYPERLSEQVRSLGLQDRVTLVGHVDDARPYYGLFDIAVNASLGEPFGLVIIEAMAACVPVVAFAAGGPLEIIEDGVNGLLVPIGDDAAMKSALRRLVQDGKLRRTLGAGARERFAEDFSDIAFARRFMRLLAAEGCETPGR